MGVPNPQKDPGVRAELVDARTSKEKDANPHGTPRDARVNGFVIHDESWVKRVGRATRTFAIEYDHPMRWPRRSIRALADSAIYLGFHRSRDTTPLAQYGGWPPHISPPKILCKNRFSYLSV